MAGFLNSKARVNKTIRNEGCVRDPPQDSFDPSHNFVTGGVGGLVEVDDARANVGFEVACMR